MFGSFVIDGTYENDIFNNVYQPEKIIVFDKSMIHDIVADSNLYNTYILNKTQKYGVKFFEVCGSNGYTYKIIIYERKQSIKEKLLTETIVSGLCKNYSKEVRTIDTETL